VVTQNLLAALQGRYLIGWYLAFLSLAATWLAGIGSNEVGPATPATTAWMRSAVPLLIAGGIHAYCLTFILRRYF
jgi:hypothetical protein